MTQLGIVRRIEGTSVWVEVNHSERREGEPVLACCTDASAIIEARKTDDSDIEPGDSVKLVSSSKSIALTVLLGFIVPIAVFFAAYTGAGALFKISSEGGKAGMGFVGLLVGGIVPVLYFRYKKPTDGRPVVCPID